MLFCLRVVSYLVWLLFIIFCYVSVWVCLCCLLLRYILCSYSCVLLWFMFVCERVSCFNLVSVFVCLNGLCSLVKGRGFCMVCKVCIVFLVCLCCVKNRFSWFGLCLVCSSVFLFVLLWGLLCRLSRLCSVVCCWGLLLCERDLSNCCILCCLLGCSISI